MIMTIMLRRRKPTVNHDAQTRLSWPSAVKMRAVVGVEVVCGIPGDKSHVDSLDGEEATSHTRGEASSHLRASRSARALPILGMREGSITTAIEHGRHCWHNKIDL